jgi:excisionase family DNA binding protein
MEQPKPQAFAVAEPQPLAYTIQEATKVAKVGRSKLYLAVSDGSLRARKLGKKTLILPADLERWLEALPSYEPKRRVAQVTA